MKKITWKYLGKRILALSAMLAVLSFEITTPKYDWIMPIQWFGQGILSGYVYFALVEKLERW